MLLIISLQEMPFSVVSQMVVTMHLSHNLNEQKQHAFSLSYID